VDWDSDNYANNTSFVSFYSASSASLRFFAYTVNYPGNYYADPQVSAQTGEAFWAGSNIYAEATTTFYYDGYNTTVGLVPLTMTAPGYDAFMIKATLHEIGHTMGLADNLTGTPGQSVMNPQAGTNDSGNNLASFPTSCDNLSLPYF